jgi:hypothetical protein
MGSRKLLAAGKRQLALSSAGETGGRINYQCVTGSEGLGEGQLSLIHPADDVRLPLANTLLYALEQRRIGLDGHVVHESNAQLQELGFQLETTFGRPAVCCDNALDLSVNLGDERLPCFFQENVLFVHNPPKFVIGELLDRTEITHSFGSIATSIEALLGILKPLRQHDRLLADLHQA